MKRFALAAVLVAGIACVVPTDMCGCPPTLGTGIIAGFVTRDGGLLVPNADVRIEVRVQGCALTGQNVVVDPPRTKTDASGHYRFLVRTAAMSDTACVRLVARASGETDSAMVDGIRMRLVPSGGNMTPQSILVDLRLP